MKKASTHLCTLLALFAATQISFAQPGPMDFDPQLVDQPIELEFQQNPKIQVVFALDVTGSMNGLLHAAKEKIWSVANSLAQTEGNPEISIGLVAYRDRGDSFVTKITDLNTDLDKVYADLTALTTGGGGDTPESVNQALFDALNRISWDENSNTLRSIFIVGDCPPHMDYTDDVKYQTSCANARQKDIVVNTILMGNNAGTVHTWKEIAQLGGGDFFHTDMNAGSIAVSTPFDEEIKRKSQEIEASKIYYGTEEVREKQEAVKEEKIKTAAVLSDESAARRASYYTSGAESADFFGDNELLNDIATGEVDIEDLDEDELPEEIKAIEIADRKDAVLDMVNTRNTQQVELEELVKQRDAYIEQNVATETRAISLTQNVMESLSRQGKKKKMRINSNAKY